MTNSERVEQLINEIDERFAELRRLLPKTPGGYCCNDGFDRPVGPGGERKTRFVNRRSPFSER